MQKGRGRIEPIDLLGPGGVGKALAITVWRHLKSKPSLKRCEIGRERSDCDRGEIDQDRLAVLHAHILTMQVAMHWANPEALVEGGQLSPDLGGWDRLALFRSELNIAWPDILGLAYAGLLHLFRHSASLGVFRTCT